MKKKKVYVNDFMGAYKELEDWHIKALEIFSKHRFDKILDVGCGNGNITLLLKEACKAEEAYGIDVSEEGVRSAREMGVKAVQIDIDEDDFPFENDFFCAIFAGEIIEHLFNPDHFLEEVRRTLKPKGIFVISTRNLASLYSRVSLLFGYLPPMLHSSLKHDVGHFRKSRSRDGDVLPGSDHIRPYTLKSLLAILRAYRFRIIKVKGLKAFSTLRSSTVLKLPDNLMSRLPNISAGIIVICEKS